MQNEYIIVLLAVIFLIYVIIHARHVKVVKENSPIYKDICSLNSNTQFLTIKNKYSYAHKYKSKQAYNKGNLKQVFLGFLDADKKIFIPLMNDLNENKKRYDEYLKEFDKITNSNQSEQFYSKYWFFRGIEKNLCKKIKMHPTMDVKFNISCSYTSPKGKNRYSKRQKYGYNEFAECIEQIINAEKFKQSKEYQRSIMTQSLRYDVMKRDGFKCVLCGASAKEGAKLHVDHIVPVSRGGKTELSNLRTLCEDCNLGKSDKYDPNGMN